MEGTTAGRHSGRKTLTCQPFALSPRLGVTQCKGRGVNQVIGASVF
jgi:hypothetical protein